MKCPVLPVCILSLKLRDEHRVSKSHVLCVRPVFSQHYVSWAEACFHCLPYVLPLNMRSPILNLVKCAGTAIEARYLHTNTEKLAITCALAQIASHLLHALQTPAQAAVKDIYMKLILTRSRGISYYKPLFSKLLRWYTSAVYKPLDLTLRSCTT